MHITRCQHIKINGLQCGSPALRGRRLCYFHHDIRRQLRPARPGHLVLPVLEDANAVQCALMQVIRAIAANQIDPKRAGLLLYALQTASYNLKSTNFEDSRGRGVSCIRKRHATYVPPLTPEQELRAFRDLHRRLQRPPSVSPETGRPMEAGRPRPASAADFEISTAPLATSNERPATDLGGA